MSASELDALMRHTPIAADPAPGDVVDTTTEFYVEFSGPGGRAGGRWFRAGRSLRAFATADDAREHASTVGAVAWPRCRARIIAVTSVATVLE